MAAFGGFLEDDREVKSYLESFGAGGLQRLAGHLPRAQDPPGGPHGLTGYINC